ncbi:MAG: Z1 domain-containing protein [Candidatus Accumulibacter sp.]|jgi:hypothetical protein|nr:Z1 domain-containing protein [Accumulibacter sp.]
MNPEERNIANALISGLANSPETPTREQVEGKARQIAAIFGYTGDIRNIVTEAMISVDTRMGAGVSLVDVAARHDDQWIHRREDVDWVYTEAYEEFLRNEGWPPQLIQSLADVTSRILGHLQDPLSEGTTWSRRGLVIGHVQSGKTANYTGLMARAADAGYKFIIVIAGIHNNLRKQTQQRIDEAFIGRSSDPDDRRNIGVSLLVPDYPHPATLTNVHDDFNKNTAARSGWKINDFSKPIILVIKKHVKTLEALYKWLKDLNAGRNDGLISDVPMLLIDDEADNASINTNREDLDPTRTNAMIRGILSLFRKSCYVGYTATPFANIFINPDAYDNDVREELFPRDFIYCLDAPTTYFGAEKVFLDEANSPYVKAIDDGENFIPWTHRRDDPVSELPLSLYRALDEFLVARAIRNLRGQTGQHCSMMVNVSRFVPVQKAVRDFLSLRARKISEAVRANYAMPEVISSRNIYMRGLRQAFDTEYTQAGFEWEQVKSALDDVFRNLHLYVINSKSDEVLDYSRYERDGIGLTVIAVGGLSLSRGLTVEGLTVSYMYRNTRMYDTLMQMGRWFGYRPGYEDLCRIHLAHDSVNWYAHIADASEELVQQVKRMRRDDLSPKDFGLYVMAHPDSLLITAANKMRSGEKVKFRQNFSGRILESYIVSTDRSVNDSNLALIEKCWRDGFGGLTPNDSGKGSIFRDVPVGRIEDFLFEFQAHSQFADRKADIVAYLRTLAERHPVGDVLLISPRGNKDKEPCKLNGQERQVTDFQGSAWRLNKDRVASRGDEGLGLSPEQRKEAEDIAKSDGKPTADRHYREIRNKPLLMIHSLDPQGDIPVKGPIAAFGVSFPPGHYDKEIEAVVNRVWLERMQGNPDDPDDEEDYDA